MADAVNSKIERLGGMRDVLPAEYERRRMAWEAIRQVFYNFGYKGIEAPILENVDLHLRKSGEAIRRHMYVFEDLGHDMLCLRPELTASVVRMYNNEMTQEPLPQKLFYHGSTFRYDRPQAGRYREFTQAGVEIIGAKGPEYDAEVLALTCSIMDALKVEDYELVIGSIGIVYNLLDKENIEERARNLIIEKLDDLGKSEDVAAGIAEIQDGLQAIGVRFDNPEDAQGELVEAVRRIDNEDVRKLIIWLLEKVYADAAAGREFTEVADNLIAQLSRDQQGPRIKRILEFIGKLRGISGRPDEAIPAARKLLEEYGVNAEPLDNLDAIAGYLKSYDIDWSRARIDFGFGRGLQYYTGMIFEIHCRTEKMGASSQVCGGGRYDALIKDLGGFEDRPSLGFSFGLERLLMAVDDAIFEQPRLDALVAPIGDAKVFNYAITIAHKLRSNGFAVDIGPGKAKPRDLTGMANRLNARFALFVGDDELEKGIVTVKEMDSGTQTTCLVDELAENLSKPVGVS